MARLSEHTGGLGAPQAVGLEAPPQVVSHSGGERIGMRDGGESRTLPRRSDPHPPIGGLVLIKWPGARAGERSFSPITEKKLAFNSSHVLVNFTYPNHLFTHITPLITQRRHIQVFGHYHKQNSKQNSAQCPKVLAV